MNKPFKIVGITTDLNLVFDPAPRGDMLAMVDLGTKVDRLECAYSTSPQNVFSGTVDFHIPSRSLSLKCSIGPEQFSSTLYFLFALLIKVRQTIRESLKDASWQQLASTVAAMGGSSAIVGLIHRDKIMNMRELWGTEMSPPCRIWLGMQKDVLPDETINRFTEVCLTHRRHMLTEGKEAREGCNSALLSHFLCHIEYYSRTGRNSDDFMTRTAASLCAFYTINAASVLRSSLADAEAARAMEDRLAQWLEEQSVNPIWLEKK